MHMVTCISSFAVRHRVVVLILWLLVLASGIYTGSHLQDRLTTTVQIPGSESDKTNHILSTEFGENFEGMFTVIYKFKNSTIAEVDQMKAKIEEAAKIIPDAQVTNSRAIAGYLFASVQTSLDLTDSALYTEHLREAIRKTGLQGALVSGPPAIKSDVSPFLMAIYERENYLGAVLLSYFSFSFLVFRGQYSFHLPLPQSQSLCP